MGLFYHKGLIRGWTNDEKMFIYSPSRVSLL